MIVLLTRLLCIRYFYNAKTFRLVVSIVIIQGGKLPGLVVNIKDSQSEPWSLDVGSIPRFI
jgi:hypothetical protein